MALSLEGHRDRMRERLGRINAEDMREQDLLEVLLYYAVPRRDTKEMSAALLSRFGAIGDVVTSDPKQIAGVGSAGKSTAEWLCALGELMEAYRDLLSIDKPMINNLGRSEKYFRGFFAGCDYPQVWQCCLSPGGRIISSVMISENASWGETEYIRDALTAAISSHAHSVVLGQFSPGTTADFEEYDVKKTMGYAITLSYAGVQLLDHILIHPGKVRSMYRNGQLDRIRQLISENALRENYLALEEENQ